MGKVIPLPEGGEDELRVHCRTVWRYLAGQRGAKMVQTEGGKTEQSRGMRPHWFGAWQVRGPWEGVGCEACEDGLKVMDEPANSQRTVDFSDSFPQGRCTRTIDGSGSEIRNS